MVDTKALESLHSEIAEFRSTLQGVDAAKPEGGEFGSQSLAGLTAEQKQAHYIAFGIVSAVSVVVSLLLYLSLRASRWSIRNSREET